MPLLLLIAGCHHLGTLPDTGVDPAGGERIAVTPDRLVFPTVSVEHERWAELTFSVTNLGADAVTVTGHDEVGAATAFAVDADPLLVIEPGVTEDLVVRFSPGTAGTWSTDLLIQPGDEQVHLEGTGTAPVIDVGRISFDAVVLGCSGPGYVPVTNLGTEALAFTSAHLTSDEFAVVGLPDEIAPGATDYVELQFTPAAGGSRTTSLVLSTNDPATPDAAVPVTALGYEGERVSESFHYAPSNPTDILFVVDTGASMAGRLAPAEAGIVAFVTDIRNTNVDYHVSSIGSGGVCPSTNPGFATRTDTSLQTEVILQQGFLDGPGPWEDDLLGQAIAALAGAEPGGCYDGFRREIADLHVVAVTDGPTAENLSDQVSTLAASAKGDAGFRLSAMVPLSGCGDDPEAWSDAVGTTGGTAGDLCASDWSAAFAAFAALPPGADPVTYPLAEPPVASSIAVEVEGGRFTSWTYDADQNAVVFDGAAIPALGAEVTIDYILAVACEG